MAKVLSNISELHKIADAMEPKLRQKFIEAVSRIKDNANLTKIVNEIKAGRIAGVMETLGLEAEFAAFQSDALQAVRVLVERGAEVAALPKGIGVSFDMTNPEVFSVIRQDVIDKVLKISVETEAAVRAAIERSFAEGIPTLQIAREIRDLVGLTQNQWATVGRYDEYLRGLADRFTSVDDLSAVAEYKLRRGGMRTLLGKKRGLGILDRTGLTGDRIETLVEKYTKKLVAERAEVISRSLTITAANEGQERLWRQAIEEDLLDPNDWDVIGIVARDDRLCEKCMSMDGKRRPMDAPFSSGAYAGTWHPAWHPACRCATGLARKSGAGIFARLKAA
ncbi:MAG: hypothetical protein V1784_05135 [bacterium]